MSTATNVSAAKPAVGGAISVGATTATLPTSTGGDLTGFKSLGYISEDGLKNDNSPESEEVKAWGGDIVMTPLTGKPDKFSFTLIECLNEEVLKFVYGTKNVTGTLSAGISITAKAEEQELHAFVIDMIMRGGVAKRIVIPQASISEIAEIEYTDGGAVAYAITITAYPDASGATHKEYLKAASAT